MNRERERLLGDILAEPGETGERRVALLNRTLRQVRRRQTVRRVHRAGTVLMLLPTLALLVSLVWRVHLPPGPQTANRQAPYVLVRTEPLPRAAVVRTEPLAPSGLVASAPSLNAAHITTRPEARAYREIDDATLLALAGTNAAVLVRLGPHSAELLFASGNRIGHTPD
jgi:hypothetical protein